MTTQEGWLVYRVVDSKLQLIGLYETHEKASADAEIINDKGKGGWQTIRAPFIGWGLFLADNNEPKPKGN